MMTLTRPVLALPRGQPLENAVAGSGSGCRMYPIRQDLPGWMACADAALSGGHTLRRRAMQNCQTVVKCMSWQCARSVVS